MPLRRSAFRRVVGADDVTKVHLRFLPRIRLDGDCDVLRAHATFSILPEWPATFFSELRDLPHSASMRASS